MSCALFAFKIGRSQCELHTHLSATGFKHYSSSNTPSMRCRPPTIVLQCRNMHAREKFTARVTSSTLRACIRTFTVSIVAAVVLQMCFTNVAWHLLAIDNKPRILMWNVYAPTAKSSSNSLMAETCGNIGNIVWSHASRRVIVNISRVTMTHARGVPPETEREKDSTCIFCPSTTCCGAPIHMKTPRRRINISCFSIVQSCV
jgi:hypothetical protein